MLASLPSRCRPTGRVRIRWRSMSQSAAEPGEGPTPGRDQLVVGNLTAELLDVARRPGRRIDVREVGGHVGHGTVLVVGEVVPRRDGLPPRPWSDHGGTGLDEPAYPGLATEPTSGWGAGLPGACGPCRRPLRLAVATSGTVTAGSSSAGASTERRSLTRRLPRHRRRPRLGPAGLRLSSVRPSSSVDATDPAWLG